jgi:glycolate oxidase iron-sulfur subunit
MPEMPGGPADILRAEESGLLACVHCGFCLNACPTYRTLGHEGDSPRGRLLLMRAVAEGRLAPDDPAFQLHIDQCLGCRACEPVCPSGVPYGFLLERARGTIAAAAGVPPSTRLLIAGYTMPGLSGLVTAASRLLRGSGLARLLVRILPRGLAAPRFGLAMLAASAPWRRLRARSPATATSAAARQGSGATQPRSEPGLGTTAEDVATRSERSFADPHGLMGAYPRATSVPAGPAGGSAPVARPAVRVGMLTGCVQASLFARVNAATERVLRANGCEVVRVPGQVCCGALDAHAGRLERARELARRNIAAFERAGVEVVVVNAAGCGAVMKEYAEQLRHDAAWHGRAQAFVQQVRDVAEFLMQRGVVRGAAVPLRVTYDAPCHLHHAQRIREAPLRLLDGVPGLERIPLAGADDCCGGAGLYGVHHPELGGAILGAKIAAIRATGAEAVATPNPGCMMQIGAGLLLHDVDVAVLHPIEILDESYRRAGEAEKA